MSGEHGPIRVNLVAYWLPFAWYLLDDYRPLIELRHPGLTDQLDRHLNHWVVVRASAAGYHRARCQDCDVELWKGPGE